MYLRFAQELLTSDAALLEVALCRQQQSWLRETEGVDCRKNRSVVVQVTVLCGFMALSCTIFSGRQL